MLFLCVIPWRSRERGAATSTYEYVTGLFTFYSCCFSLFCDWGLKSCANFFHLLLLLLAHLLLHLDGCCNFPPRQITLSSKGTENEHCFTTILMPYCPFLCETFFPLPASGLCASKRNSCRIFHLLKKWHLALSESSAFLFIL